jgi:hypothetical protein
MWGTSFRRRAAGMTDRRAYFAYFASFADKLTAAKPLSFVGACEISEESAESL